ncbi:hypothetical protein SAMN05444340_107137 [Citreimonas salinaria]|uniref:Uncharacterized protein n=2 Tax=Citreimonas salinaria TaxID=321339 RepID=A0A1H3JMI8_9RHOB|nr:hypothetical protein SAMN05444340_107137 [Citreimonas salinaria]
MQFSITTLSMAPMITGHPLGLPEAKRATKSPYEIKPIAKRGDIDSAIADARTPAEFRRAVSGRPTDDQAAPPSMLQIRISQLLAEEIAPPEPGKDDTAETREQPAVAPAPRGAAQDTTDRPVPFIAGAQAYPALPELPAPQLDKAS